MTGFTAIHRDPLDWRPPLFIIFVGQADRSISAEDKDATITFTSSTASDLAPFREEDAPPVLNRTTSGWSDRRGF